MEKNDEIVSFSARCAVFLDKNHKAISLVFGLVCAVVAIALISVFFTGRGSKRSSEITEALISEWLELQEKKPENATKREDALIIKLEAQAKKSGFAYASFRGYSTLGEIFVLRKDWKKAMEAYEKAGKAVSKVYAAGVAYFNAAACADELKNYEKALALYTLSANSEDFPLKPRSIFNIGRLEELLKHTDKAIEAYSKLSEQFPDNSWALLGKSRMIALSLQK